MGNKVNFNDLVVGYELPVTVKKPIDRTTLALFAGASGDHNPIHIDSDVAHAAGMDDVFAQGMLSMAYLAQCLTGAVPQSVLRSYSARFGAITHLRDEISCRARVCERREEAGVELIRLELTAANQNDEVKLQGEAVLAISQKEMQ